MKINSGFRPMGSGFRLSDQQNQQPVGPKSFSDMMNQQDERANKEQLQRMLQQIDRQAERLIKSMTVRELRAYKLLVKQFLEETVRRGIGIRETKGWDRRGRSKRFKILDEIDKLLVDMAEELLEQEQGRIELLDKIGEVRGMLINYYF